jgi:hypothetical protein
MQTEYTYNLSNIPGFDNIINNNNDPNNEKYYIVKDYITKSNQQYKIVRYNKDLLSSDLFSTYGLLRSVIISANKVVSFSPPKSISSERFIQDYDIKDVYAEEFIEGTMINVFFDSSYGITGCWQIATRNTVGADVSFYTWSKKTFNIMFMEACLQNNICINSLNPEFCYSFVLQHPENRVVVPFTTPNLYLVEVYKILHIDNEVKVLKQDLDTVKQYGLWTFSNIKFPQKILFESYSELIEKYASPNTPYNILGIIVKNKNTGERMKIRNPIYEEIRHLRGNQPKLQYQYLCLRKEGKISDFIKYYPETKSELSQYRSQIHMFTNTLFKNYISCFVKKEKSLYEFSDQYKTHMFKLHEIFLNDLREKNLFVNKTVVINYVNNLHPSLLMYSLNYNMRKRLIDTINEKS